MGLKRKTPLRTKKPLKAKKPSLGSLLKSGAVAKASSFKSRPKPMKKIAKNNKGWWDVALEIWEERPHVCEVSGEPLGDVPRPSFFSHLLPRGTYPDFKRDKRNIRLQHPEIHHMWHQEKLEDLARMPEWRDTVELYLTLRDEANGI